MNHVERLAAIETFYREDLISREARDVLIVFAIADASPDLPVCALLPPGMLAELARIAEQAPTTDAGWERLSALEGVGPCLARITDLAELKTRYRRGVEILRDIFKTPVPS